MLRTAWWVPHPCCVPPWPPPQASSPLPRQPKFPNVPPTTEQQGESQATTMCPLARYWCLPCHPVYTRGARRVAWPAPQEGHPKQGLTALLQKLPTYYMRRILPCPLKTRATMDLTAFCLVDSGIVVAPSPLNVCPLTGLDYCFPLLCLDSLRESRRCIIVLFRMCVFATKPILLYLSEITIVK